jgi:hypothetical protein
VEQELLRTERHHSLLISVGIILPAESNLVMLESHEAMVGDGYAMGRTFALWAASMAVIMSWELELSSPSLKTSSARRPL